MQRSGVRPSVCLSRRSTAAAACGWFAAERPVSAEYQLTVGIRRIPFRLQGPSSENVRSLSQVRQIATHYRVTFAISHTLIRLSYNIFLLFQWFLPILQQVVIL